MIIVFGSLNVDMVLPVESMPRPGDTLLCPEYKLHPGGKGANQAVAAAHMGADVHMFGCVGDDSFSHLCRDSLNASKVQTQYMVTCDKPTGCATICVDARGENMITVASGANLLASSALVPDEMLTDSSILVLQMEVRPEENWQLIERASQRGTRVILNLAPAQAIPDHILKSLSVLVMNQIEATVLALNLGFDIISPTIAARRISSKYGITCIVTLGADGAFAASPQGTWTVQALPITAVDTTAAGDAFVGVFAASLAKDMTLDESLRRATVASGLACTSVGAQTSLPDAQQVEQYLPLVPVPRRGV
jgi:ribokinase